MPAPPLLLARRPRVPPRARQVPKALVDEPPAVAVAAAAVVLVALVEAADLYVELSNDFSRAPD